MGLVKVKGEIGLRQDNLEEIEFLVDTGSLYTFLPPDLASGLGTNFTVPSQVVLADRRSLEVLVGVAYLRLAGREGGIIVASMDVPMPLLGATALEILGLNINPVEETVEHSRPFGPAALLGGSERLRGRTTLWSR
jgi:clan AA aspartic protease